MEQRDGVGGDRVTVLRLPLTIPKLDELLVEIVEKYWNAPMKTKGLSPLQATYYVETVVEQPIDYQVVDLDRQGQVQKVIVIHPLMVVGGRPRVSAAHFRWFPA